MTKRIALGDVFTADDLAKARKIVREANDQDCVTRIAAEVVRPRMPEIDRVSGQTNDDRYMAYCLYAAIKDYLGDGARPIVGAK